MQFTPPPPATGLPQATGITSAKTPFELRAQAKAREFESVLLTTFVEQMFAGIKTDGPFGGGHSEEVYRSLLSKEYAQSIADAGGIGLSDHVYREMLELQQTEK